MNNRLRMLKCSSMYQEYINYIYCNQSLRELSYDKQYRILMDGLFGWSDFWKRHLEDWGGYDVEEIVVNAEPLQKKWASEHGINYSSGAWMTDILDAQIRSFQPDILFVHDDGNVSQDFVRLMKSKYPCIKITIGVDGVAHNNRSKYAQCDIILSCLKSTVKFYEDKGIRALFFPHSFEPVILKSIKPCANGSDAIFAGSMYLGDGGHFERVKWLGELSRSVPISLRISPEVSIFSLLFAKRILNQICHLRFSLAGDLACIYSRNQGAIYGKEMYEAFAAAKIVVNCHINAAGKEAANSRLFEATGAGTCLVTDWKENIGKLFDPEKEIVTYKTTGECIEKIRMLLRDDEHRKRIARAGQKRTLSDHTLRSRLELLDTELRKIV